MSRYVIRPPKGNQWGAYDPQTESWTGMIGDVANRRAELAIGMITQTIQRSAVSTFSDPYMLDSLSFVTSAPQLQSRAFIVLQPFTWQVSRLLSDPDPDRRSPSIKCNIPSQTWLAVVASVLASGVIYYLLHPGTRIPSMRRSIFIHLSNCSSAKFDSGAQVIFAPYILVQLHAF